MIFSIIQFFWTGGWILTHNYIQQHAQLIKIPLFPSISNNVHSLNTDPRSYILQSYQYFIILSFISLLLFWDVFSLLLLIFKNRLVLIFSHCYHSSVSYSYLLMAEESFIFYFYFSQESPDVDLQAFRWSKSRDVNHILSWNSVALHTD